MPVHPGFHCGFSGALLLVGGVSECQAVSSFLENNISVFSSPSSAAGESKQDPPKGTANPADLLGYEDKYANTNKHGVLIPGL